MTTIKFLSAGLIAIATLTTPAVAHENSIAGRHLVLKSNASPNSATGRWIYRRTGTTEESHTAPQNQPGGVCDNGDNPAIC